MKLRIKTYQGNCTIFGDHGWLPIDYSADECSAYESNKEFLDEVRLKITEWLDGEIAENLEEIINTISIFSNVHFS